MPASGNQAFLSCSLGKIMKIKGLLVGLVCVANLSGAVAQEFDIKHADGTVRALNFGQSDHVVIALHGSDGGRSQYKSWGDELAKAGFRVISIDWPASSGGGFKELAAAVKFARDDGAQKISLLGYSRGAALAANYARVQPDGEFNTLVLLSSADETSIPLTKTKKLFVFNKYDSIARWGQAGASKSAEPKQVLMLGGGGHQISALVSEKADLLQDIAAALKR